MTHLKYFFTLIIFQGLCICSQAEDHDMVVVVNINNPTTTMTKSQVIDLFMGRYIAFPNGQQATPIELMGEAEMKKNFYQYLVGMSLARVNAYWSRIKYTGRVKASKKVRTSKKVIGLLATSPVSISYMLREDVTKDLKVVYALNE